MSSFKRKGPAKSAPSYPATRISPASSLTIITSTGIPSLDDILGGGLPLSCSLLVAAPDYHTSYGDLVQKYFVAQGLKSGHRVCVVDDNGEEFAKDLMWTPKPSAFNPGDINKPTPSPAPQDEDDEKSEEKEEKIRIAWRYEQMKQFQTTVSPSSSYAAEDYCAPFDLTSCVPGSIIRAAQESGQLSFIPLQQEACLRSPSEILEAVRKLIQPQTAGGSATILPTRICIPSLGSPSWGDLRAQDLVCFLHSLRTVLRTASHACASISLPPHISTNSWGGPGWLQKIGWSCDAAVTMSAFSADPSLREIFPNQHGLLHIHTLPAPHTLLSPSDRFSVLRGLSASTGATGAGENNLAFKSTRKRLIFETLHLDIEGGVGERRTTPAASASTLGDDVTFGHAPHEGGHSHSHDTHKVSVAAVEVAVESSEPKELEKKGLVGRELGPDKGEAGQQPNAKPKKAKKSVAFRADRPDLYDF